MVHMGCEHTCSGPAFGMTKGDPAEATISFHSYLKWHTGKTPDWGFLTFSTSTVRFQEKTIPNPFKVSFYLITWTRLLKITPLFSWHLTKVGPQGVLSLGLYLLQATVCDFSELIFIFQKQGLFFYIQNPSFFSGIPQNLQSCKVHY